MKEDWIVLLSQPIHWLKLPIHCAGRLIRSSMREEQIDDLALSEICLRMHLILDSIEYERAEGRLMNVSIFEAIDSLHSNLIQGQSLRLGDWRAMILHFGEYYRLNQFREIEITARSVENAGQMAHALGLKMSVDAA